MRPTTRPRATSISGALLMGFAALFAANGFASAQTAPVDPNQTNAYLVLQDFSDCTNQNVPNADSPLVGGYIWITRMPDGNTVVRVAMTAEARTTYHLFLKCVRLLGDITTDDKGTAEVSFTFPTNSVGTVFAFDMYPEGAPLGNKFQSSQIAFK